MYEDGVPRFSGTLGKLRNIENDNFSELNIACDDWPESLDPHLFTLALQNDGGPVPYNAGVILSRAELQQIHNFIGFLLETTK
jgi:hypothetical protein